MLRSMKELLYLSSPLFIGIRKKEREGKIIDEREWRMRLSTLL